MNVIRHLTTLLLASTPLAHGYQEHKERHLGPTGMYGETSPTEIKIVKVEKGSPADRIIKPGDVITAAGGIPFKDRTRKQLAEAIDLAESTGKLTLTLKNGSSVDLKLPVIGSYSDTAPIKCPKTDAIIALTGDYLVKTKDLGREDLPIALMGLLATGDKKYISFVKKQVRDAKWADPKLKLPIDKYVRSTWSWGYITMFLSEYYLLTKDSYVLPALETYAVAIAKGRDAGGLWGHGIASLDLNRGQMHGRLPGYAHMNQSSLPMFLSLVLAEKCGIRHPEVLATIKQNNTFYSSFIGRGTLPYGVHNPIVGSFNNNGMSGLAAVAFSVHGNKPGTQFFSRMAAASHNTMETGHTGHFFNQLWTGPGANLAGPETHSAFFRETRWLHILNRKWDGNFTYDCSGSPKGNYSYRNLSDAGSHLINHCLGRRVLYITGRDSDPSLWLKGAEVQATLALATLDLKKMDDATLLKGFGHYMPKIRADSVNGLRSRDHQLHREILSMITKGSPLQRESAIKYFGSGCPAHLALEAKPTLLKLLRDSREPADLRAAAAASLAALGDGAHDAYPDMLRFLVTEKTNDPLGRIDESLGASLTTLAPDPYSAGLVTDKELFYGAVKKLVNHPRASGRTSGMEMIAHMPIEDFHWVGNEIAEVMKDRKLTYHSYHNLGPRNAAMTMFANFNIEGGIDAALGIFDEETGKHGFKVRMLMDVLPKYGAAAKPYLPKLKEMHPGQGRFAGPWDEMISAIENAPAAETKTITFEEAMKTGSK